MTPKMEPKSSSGAGGLRESLRERSWRFLEAPRDSPEAPESAPGALQEPPEAQNETQEVSNDPQEAPNDPQEGQNEPQASQRELREVTEASRERFGQDFRSIFKQRDATETLPTQIAGEGA